MIDTANIYAGKYTVKVRKWEDAVALAVAKRGAYRAVDGGYVIIWEPKQQQKGA